MQNAASIDDKGYIKKVITLNLHLKNYEMKKL